MSTDALCRNDRKPENSVRTVTFASKLFFFFTVLVSAKDEYEQYFLLSRKKNVECTEKISSVFMLVVLIDEENLLDKTLLQSFVGGLVFQRSSDFFRKRLFLCFFFLQQVPQEYTPRRFARKQNDCDGVVFLKDLLSVLPGESG